MVAKGTTPEGFAPPAPAPDSPHASGASVPRPREDIEARVATLNYEEARARLVDIVSRLEQGSIPLEESLRLWEVGESLARHCQSWLDGAAARIDAAERGESLADLSDSTSSVTDPAQAAGPGRTTGTPAPPTAPTHQAPSAAVQAGGYQAPAPAIPPQASKEDRVAALREAVREVRAEDVPAIQAAPQPVPEAASAPAPQRGAAAPAGAPEGATAPQQPSVANPPAGDDDDFDPEEFADGTGLDTTPLTRHPEDFA